MAIAIAMISVDSKVNSRAELTTTATLAITGLLKPSDIVGVDEIAARIKAKKQKIHTLKHVPPALLEIEGMSILYKK